MAQVAEYTARLHDKDGFQVWPKTMDPPKIPHCRLLFIREPAGALSLGYALGAPDALRYSFSIRRLAPPIRMDTKGGAPPPPLPPTEDASKITMAMVYGLLAVEVCMHQRTGTALRSPQWCRRRR